jgi:RNA polymerase sigma-70 factor, ECF subfamily
MFQDCLLKAMENFDKLDDDTKFRNWFFTIITNTYISFYRKSRLRRFLSVDEFNDLEKLPDVFPRTEAKDIYDNVYLALSRLKTKEKVALLLFEIGGFSIEEIKVIQNEKSSSAVKSRLSRTREKLKKIINDMESNRSKKLFFKSVGVNNLETETEKIIKNIKPEKQGG